MAPAWRVIGGGASFQLDEFIELVRELSFTGITIAGGEPFLQSSALAHLIKTLSQDKIINTVCYSGYSLAELLSFSRATNELLQCIDVLIDGEYIESQNNNFGLKGSSNQVVYHFTEALRDFDFDNADRKVAIIPSDDSVLIAGIPSKTVLSGLIDFFNI